MQSEELAVQAFSTLGVTDHITIWPFLECGRVKRVVLFFVISITGALRFVS